MASNNLGHTKSAGTTPDLRYQQQPQQQQQQQLNRRRSVTLQPLTSISKPTPEINQINPRGNKLRVYSVSSDIVPQTLLNTEAYGDNNLSSTSSELHTNSRHNDQSGYGTSNRIIDKNVILNNNDNLQKLSNTMNNTSSSNTTPKWSNVGFQSIFQAPGLRKSNTSLRSSHSSSSDVASMGKKGNKKLIKAKSANHIKTSHITPMRKSSDSFERAFKTHNPLHSVNHRHTANDLTSVHSNSDVESGHSKVRRNSIFSLSTIKGNSDKLFKSSSNKSSNMNLSSSLIDTSMMSGEKTPLSPQKLNVAKVRASRENTINSIGSNNSNTNSSMVSTSSNKSSNPFVKITRKIFRSKSNQHIKDTAEPAIPNSLSKFLHSSVGRHRSPVHFIHNTTGGIIDSGKSVYSFNPTVLNATNDAALAITQQDDALDSTNVAILHDLLKNMASLEANYKSFNSQELFILSGNVWGIYCSVVVELFKNQRIWQLPAKIEDINRILRFYIQLKTNSKISTTWTKIFQEMEEFIITSLYVFENQVVFNYNNEDTMNTALKRLGVLWQLFYQEIYYDIIAVLLPLETSFQNHSKHSKKRTDSTTKRDNVSIVSSTKSKDYTDSISLDNTFDSEVIGPKRMANDDTLLKTGNSYNGSTLSTIATASSNSSSTNIATTTGNNVFLDLNIDFNRVNSSNNLSMMGSNNPSPSKPSHSSDKNKFSIEHLLLKCFRDSIVLPYYQNFIHSDDGVSKSFYAYILNEEEESGVTEEDKLTLLQCFGILSTIQGSDRHQQIMEDLLEGVRMSI